MNSMYKKYILTQFLILFLLLFFSAEIAAQSSLTKNGLNGAMFDGYTSFKIDNDLDNDLDNLLGGFGGRLGYSIGGILDVGAVFSLSYGEVESRGSSETNIGLRYGIMLLKQEDRVPVSLQINGEYGYSFVESDYFTEQNPQLQREGQGYDLKMSLYRDVGSDEDSMTRLGLFGGIRSYNYTTQSIDLVSAEEQTFYTQRDMDFLYGISIYFIRKSPQGKSWYFGLEPALDGDLKVSGALRTGLVFELR